MTDTADVLVIGGGVIGTSIAWALSARGVKRVTLVEQGALASGASGRSSAIIRMHYTTEANARLALASLPLFTHWGDVFGGAPVFTPSGFMALVGGGDVDALGRNIAMLQRIGVKTSRLTREDINELQPMVALDDLGGAAYEPDSGYASPADVVEGFARCAGRHGARMLAWTRVTRLVRHQSRVIGVETSRGRIDAGAVIVATGAWTGPLCRAAGVEVPVRPQAIDTVVVRRPPSLAAPHMTVIDHVLGTYFRPESGTMTLVDVPCSEDIDPDAPSSGVASEAPDVAAQLLIQRFPAMADACFIRGYRAFDGYSPDHHAILGPVEGLRGLYLATGFSGSGFKLAPSVGTCIAELVTEGEANTVDIRPFRPERFAEGQSLEAWYPYTSTRALDARASEAR
jgi:sarcosine oxidase, subunit beta